MHISLITIGKLIATFILVIFIYKAMDSRPTEEELNEFQFITRIHKLLVAYLGKILNGKDYDTHDNSKFTQYEIEPYVLKFVRLSPNEKNPGWKDAVGHHYKNNKHHAQYWRFLNSPMPEEYIMEAVVDMMAARYQYQINREIVEVVRVNKYEIDKSKLFQSMNEHLRKEDFYDFQEKFLTPYTDDEKSFIKQELSKHKENVFSGRIDLSESL